MELFVRDILFELPENCIYLCSSDEGRFAIQAYRDALEKRGVYIVSYNRLNDASYISYLRWQHGDAIKLPQRDDISRAMQSYIKEAREGETPFSGGSAILKGNALQLTGPGAVLAINSKLTRIVWERNCEKFAVMVESEHPLPWLYEHAIPDGLLMRLAPVEPEFTTLRIRRSDLYWQRRLTKPLRGLHVAARRYAQLRHVQAVAMASRGFNSGAEKAFTQSIDTYPSPRTIISAVVELYIPGERYDEARKLLKKRTTAMEKVKTSFGMFDRIASVNLPAISNDIDRSELRLARMLMLSSAESSLSNRVELATLQLEHKLNKEARATVSSLPLEDLPRDKATLTKLFDLLYSVERADQALSLLSLAARDIHKEKEPEVILDLTGVALKHHVNGPAIAMLTRYIELKPKDWHARLDLATLYSVTSRNRLAKDILNEAIAIGGDEAQKIISENKRFKKVLSTPDAPKNHAEKR